MIIDDLHILRSAIPPDETNPPSLVDADAELPGPVCLEGLESISRRHAEIDERRNRVELDEFAARSALEAGEFADKLVIPTPVD
jgi:hypothetical protein